MDKKYPNGIIFKKKRDGSPDFVKGGISIKVDEAIKWMQEIGGEWINLDLIKSDDGKLYLKYNDWKPASQKAIDVLGGRVEKEIDVDSIPF